MSWSMNGHKEYKSDEEKAEHLRKLKAAAKDLEATGGMIGYSDGTSVKLVEEPEFPNEARKSP